MKKLFELGNQYCRESDWRDLALVKFCLCSIGVMMGVFVPRDQRKRVCTCAALVFLVTYVPLMWKLFRIALREKKD